MDRQERIRARAHEIWIAHGQPEGHEADHWTQAEREIDGEAAQDGGRGADKPRRNKAALDLVDVDPDSNHIPNQTNLDQQAAATKPKRARSGAKKA